MDRGGKAKIKAERQLPEIVKKEITEVMKHNHNITAKVAFIKVQQNKDVNELTPSKLTLPKVRAFMRQRKKPSRANQDNIASLRLKCQQYQLESVYAEQPSPMEFESDSEVIYIYIYIYWSCNIHTMSVCPT